MEEILGKSGPVRNMQDLRNEIRFAQFEIELKYVREIAILETNLKRDHKEKERLEKINQVISEELTKTNLELKRLLEESKEEVARLKGATKKTLPEYVPGVIKSAAAAASAAEFNLNSSQSAKKLEDIREVHDLKRRLTESEEINARLKEQFRRATHMRAGDVAEKLLTSCNPPGGPDDGWSDASEGLNDAYTPELGSQDSNLPPKLQEIDFLSLDDVLGKDDGFYVTSMKETIKDIPTGDINMTTELADSGPEIVQDDDEYFKGPLSLLEPPSATAPTILKVNIDVKNLRTGGEYAIKLPQDSEREGPYNGPTQGKMVWQYGIVYEPSENDRNCLRTVHIANLPENIQYPELLAKVRGGAIVSATICNSFLYGKNRPGLKYHKSALVVFLKEKSAREYVQAVRKNPIFFDCPKDGRKRATILLLEKPTYPLSDNAKDRIHRGNGTRVIFIQVDGLFSIDDYKAVIRFGIEKAWADDEGNLHFYFTSIFAASTARKVILDHPVYHTYRIKFLPDPCGRRLSGLHGVDNIDEIVLDYGDVDDEGEEPYKAKTVEKQKMNKEVDNADEIIIDDDDDELHEDSLDTPKSGKSDDGEDSHDNASSRDGSNSSGGKSHHSGNSYAGGNLSDRGSQESGSSSSSEALAESEKISESEARSVDAELSAPNGTSSPGEEYASDEVSLLEDISQTQDISQMEGVSQIKESPTAEEPNVLDTGMVAPKSTQLVAPDFSDASSITTTNTHAGANEDLLDWADDTNETIATGALKTPPELNHLTAPESPSCKAENDPVLAIVRLPTIIEESFNHPPITKKTVEKTRNQLLIELANNPDIPDPAAATSSSFPLNPFPRDPLIPEHLDPSGTDLDPQFLVRDILDAVILPKKKGQGLATSMWADKPSVTSTVKLSTEPPASLNKPSEPSALKTVLESKPKPVIDKDKSILDITSVLTGPRALQPPLRHPLPRRPACLAKSRYASLSSPKAERSLRSFFKDVDSAVAATRRGTEGQEEEAVGVRVTSSADTC